MHKPLLLDLFCGAGGCAKGYQQAGFYVIGVDIAPQPRYCGEEFYQDDAFAVLAILLAGGIWHGYRLSDFQAIHASPPCQEYSQSRHIRNAITKEGIKPVPKLIAPIRAQLEHSGLPWVIENVAGADLPDALELCGSMFGLPIQRHRWFASSILLFAPGPCRHMDGFYNAIGRKIRGYGSLASNRTYQDARGATRKREGYYTLAVGRKAMGIEWMSLKELSQAVPPPYTECVGQQVMEVL